MMEQIEGKLVEAKTVIANDSLAYYAYEFDNPSDENKEHRMAFLAQIEKMFAPPNVTTLKPKSENTTLTLSIFDDEKNTPIDKDVLVEKLFFCGWDFDRMNAQIAAVFQVSNGVNLKVGTATLGSVLGSYDVEYKLLTKTE